MSELKHQLMLNKDRSWVPCYLKSEADKVIENRDMEIAKLKDSIGKLLKVKTEQVMDEVIRRSLIYGEGFVPVEHAMRLVADIRHQKYKRCLAMAMWCRTSARYDEGLSAFKYRDWYWKWHKRWLELAKKFNEGLVIGFDKATGTDKTVVINYKEAK